MQVVTTSKVLVLGKTQINLVFRSLIRTFDGLPLVSRRAREESPGSVGRSTGESASSR